MIRNEMIKLSSPVLIDCICTLFNTMIKSGRVPTGWAHSYIIPIFKGGSDTDTTNYRGISIISCLAKLFSAILNTRLITHIDGNHLLSHKQIGFCKNKRTSDHIFVLKAIIEEAKSKRVPIYGCFVDLKKGFDTIWRQGLFYKMLNNFN